MRILILYAGGVPFFEDLTAQQIQSHLNDYLAMQLMVKADVHIVSRKAGADALYADANQLGQRIAFDYDRYDGFIIIHGLDNVIYVSNLLQFMFGTLGKPVIFTGCTLPDEHLEKATPDREQGLYREMSLRANLVTALQLSTMNCAGVILAYGTHIVRSVRAMAPQQNLAQYFTSYGESDAAEVLFGIQVAAHAPKRHEHIPQFTGDFSKDVYIMPAYPEMTIPADVAERYRAVIISGYQEQLLPTNLNLPNTIPVIIHSQNQAALRPGNATNVIVVPNATFPAILTKTMATLGQTTTTAEFVAAFKHNRFSEFN